MSDSALLAAMGTVENAWLSVLVGSGVAPATARADVAALLCNDDAETLAAGAEADGNPVTGLVAMLRARAGGETARWLHRGLTSQDVIDTALVLCLRDATARIRAELTAQVRSLLGLVAPHHRTPMLARTLTQPALPSTVGAKVATWLSGVLDAADTLTALPALPVQNGGAAGTLAAATELAGSPAGAVALTDRFASMLALEPAPPWHTNRSVITRAGDALVGCCDAWGHIAADVATGSRREIGEWVEGRGGGSSTMPHKRNPVLSLLIRRAALAAPTLSAALHAASAVSVDERADGGWHVEWSTLRILSRRTVVAAAQTSDLLSGLRVDVDRAAANLAAAGDVLAEQRTMTELTGRTPRPDYLGATGHLIDGVLSRARHYVQEAM